MPALRACSASVEVADAVKVALTDPTEDAVVLFTSFPPADRTEVASEIWRIGLRAMRSAFVQAEQARLADIGETLMADIGKEMRLYGAQQHTILTQVLATYFDPNDGKVTERLREFTRDDGSLATLLKQNLHPENSVLAQTLAQRMGETSPLFRLLSPTDSQGLVKQLEATIKTTLDSNRTSMAQALDPRVADSPVALFLQDLQKELQKNEDDRDKQLKTLTKELDANSADSLLSQLVRRTDAAQRELKDAMNPDNAGSPMSVIKAGLTAVLEEHAAENKAFWEEQRLRQQSFEVEIREALARIETRKAGERKSPQGGFSFEDAVTEFAQEAVQGAPLTVEPTRGSVGLVPHCKKGDQVLRFTQESAFAGCGMVVEAKREPYTVEKALEYLKEAKANRACAVGVFVQATSHAPPGFPHFARYGSDILVTWDAEDERTDPWLHAALLAGLALASRTQRQADDAELDAIADIEQRLRHELGRLEEMEKLTGNIKRDAGKIDDEIRGARKKIGVLIQNAGRTMKALNIEVRADEEEKKTPIALIP